MSIKLPPPITAYFESDRGQGKNVAECFTPDATVLDEGKTYHGTSEIHAWRADVAAKFTYTCEPRRVEHQGDATVVTCRLEGDFPGGVADLRFFFKLVAGKISSLEVIV